MNTSPPVLEYLDLLIERAAPRRLVVLGDRVDIIVKGLRAGLEVAQLTRQGAARPAALSELGEPALARFSVVDYDAETPAPLDSSLLRDSIVVALDVVDSLADARPLLAVLAAARSACRFMLFDAIDRTRREGYGAAQAPNEDLRPARWTAETFFDELLSLGFPASMLFGFVGSAPGPAPKDSMLVISGAEAEFRPPARKVRIAAVLNVFDEIDIIDEVVRYLAAQAIEVHVIDNWSDDGTYELCQSLKRDGLIKALSRFPGEPAGEYEWAKQLEHAGGYAAALDADWIIHYDADEIRCAPWRGVNLHDGICFVDVAGYTAIDFTVIDFRFTEPGGGPFETSSLRHFEFARHPSSFVQVKAWKNLAPVDLARFGGHEVVFAQRRIYPIKFLTRHYSLRSSTQAARKVFRNRLPRIGKERTELGWHVHFDQYKYLDRIEQWSPGEVMLFDPRTFDHEFLLERIGGAGVPRDEQVYLNRNTARSLNEKFAVVADRVSELDEQARQAAAELAARDRLIARTSEQLLALPALHRELAELRQQAAARERTVDQLHQVLDQRQAEIGSLSGSLDEARAQLSGFQWALQDRDAHLEDMNRTLGALRAEADRLVLAGTKLSEALSERQSRVDALQTQAEARQAEAEALRHAVERGERRGEALQAEVEALHHAVGRRDRQIEEFNLRAMQDADRVVHLRQEADRTRGELDRILRSHSWAVTRPLRVLRRIAVGGAYRQLRKQVSDLSRWCWHHLPASAGAKRELKGLAFGRLPSLFGWSQAYHSWVRHTGQPSLDAPRSPAASSPLGHAVPVAANPDGCEHVPLLHATPLANPPARLICFYLPQFHAIPENDAWWGEGFTEWTNVRPAQPQFENHYQPHEPGELGYYDLLDPAVQKRQVELAKLYGIAGFCFYFYWFGGRRLLETPTENYLRDPSLDLPFCLCWANENWSRRWDGLSSEILIAQQHSPEDDLAFIEHVARYMRDPRYLRIDGKPLLLVYRPGLLPSPRETTQRWREWCRAHGLGEIYLAYTQSFETVPPKKYGFDAAIEFPPNNSSPPDITGSVRPAADDFDCTVYDWNVFVARSGAYKQPGYKLFRSVCPAWDNTPRRKNRATVFLNSNAEAYRRWLDNAIGETRKQFTNPDERLVFVNAWNEWAEGAHLEPDRRHGYAYLQATRDALIDCGARPSLVNGRIVLVAHDAHPHGAQLLSLHLAQTLAREFGIQVALVCLGDGPLKAQYSQAAASFHDLSGQSASGDQARALAAQLVRDGYGHALVNTTVSGQFLATLAEAGIECVSLVHEMAGVLRQYGLQEHARSIARHAKKVVFAAPAVADAFGEFTGTAASSQVVIRPQGLYKRRLGAQQRDADRARLRQLLDLPPDCWVVLGVGYADHRKGIDLFVEAGLAMAARAPLARWVWIGHWDDALRQQVKARLAHTAGLAEIFVFPGLQADTEVFYGGADVFALTSREDPFPSVVLEAMDAGLPVVGFKDVGGFDGLLSEGFGELVPAQDAAAFALAVANLLEQPERRRAMGRLAADMVARRFSFRHYVFDLLGLLGSGPRKVSVIVPNYNYERFLPARLSSILEQDYPVYEILFLDDASTDGSVALARRMLEQSGIDHRIVVNERNSGSVFRQWKKGVELAAGDYVWIAEADDGCDKAFLREVVKGFDMPEVVLSYCESKQTDENGHVLADNYLTYVADIGADRWRQAFIKPGAQEVSEALSVKNTIPNVSGVVFAAEKLRGVLRQHMELVCDFRVAGDWLVYILLLQSGSLAFSPAPLNWHRRHGRGVTIGNFNRAQLEEIRRMQMLVAEKFEVPAETASLASRYLDTLTRQFGLENR